MDKSKSSAVYNHLNNTCLFFQANSTGRHVCKVEVHVIHVAFIRGIYLNQVECTF